MTYKTGQNNYSEHCRVALEGHQEGQAYMAHQTWMSAIFD